LVAPCPISPGELSLRVNLALAQAFLFRAASVLIAVNGNARALVRQAALYGLIVTVKGHAEAEASLEISGPLSLFRHTLVYGRALSALVPILPWCPRYTLEAACVLKGEARRFHLRPTDPVFPSAEPRRYDSALEERFARDFARAAPDWNLTREPQPVAADGALIFPDFAVEHRSDPDRRWLIEIVGFWTPDYLEKKLARLRAAGLERLILCVDEGRACAEGELPQGARLVRFHRRIDAAAVLALIEGTA
jgi:predicted nuclease of restriction endonuclease-like RecB superfamily